ncbi:MAG: SDR family oxidoreductase [Chroococcales cyanobacterium]
MQLSTKVALITGGGSGIGKATAQRFLQEGAKVAILGHTSDKVEKAAQEMNKGKDEVLPITADISQSKAMQEAIQRIIKQWGRLDIVFANAGINGVWAPIEELDPDEWYKTVNVNLNGTYHTIKYAVPYLKKQGGSIIITSSVNGTRMFSNSGATAYACTKAAQVALAKMLAVELGSDRIRVNVICPGAISTNISSNTEMKDIEKAKKPVKFPEGNIPLTDGEIGCPEDVAELVLFLASDASRLISGTEIWIDGAQSLLMG